MLKLIIYFVIGYLVLSWWTRYSYGKGMTAAPVTSDTLGIGASEYYPSIWEENPAARNVPSPNNLIIWN